MGADTTASGDISTAMGENTTASGQSSTAMGYETKAFGKSSTAMGNYTNASGLSSTAMGDFTTAYNDYSLSIGRQNKSNQSKDNTAFVIGNGTDNNKRDAFKVSFNGEVKINDSYTLPITAGTSGQVLQTDGNGTLSWVNILPTTAGA